MYLDRETLEALELHMRYAAVDRSREAGRCAICDVPPAPRGVRNVEELSRWFERFSRRIGVPVGRAPRSADDHAVLAVRPLAEEERRCLVCDSQLSPTIGIPEFYLNAIVDILSPDQRAVLEDGFVFTICDVCRYSENALDETAQSLLERYIEVNHEGDEASFERDVHHEYVMQIIALIDEAAESARSVRATG